MLYDHGRGGAHDYLRLAPGEHRPQSLADTLQSRAFQLEPRGSAATHYNDSVVVRGQTRPRTSPEVSTRTGSTQANAPGPEYQPFRPMTDRWRSTYGERIIASQPKTRSTKAARTSVSLTPAETRVLAFLPTYLTLAAIGTELGVGRPTVKTHVENIYKKLGASTRAEAVRLAETAGLLPHP